MVSNLTSTDLDLLKIIRDINLNPSEYEGTEGGVVPATTTAVRKATDLSRSQITYRSAPSQGGYMGEDGRGLVEIHDAQVDDETSALGPKSLELTQKGVDALSEYTKGMEATDGKSHTGSGSSNGGEISTADEREVIRQLHAKVQSLESEVQNSSLGVDELRSEIQRVESRLDELSMDMHIMGQAEWGAVDGEKADNLERVLSRAPAMMYAFTALLQIDIDDIVEAGGYTEEEMDEVRKEVFTVLDSAAGNPVGVDSTPADTTSPESESGSDSENSPPGSADITKLDPDGWEHIDDVE